VAPWRTARVGRKATARPTALYISTIEGVLRSADSGLTWSFLNVGRVVGIASGGGNIYAADQWSPTFHSASLSDSSTWTNMPAPGGLASDQGCPWLDYDAAHHLLYASCFVPLSGAPPKVWRRAVP
jgi:hypothetical protein